MDIIDELEKDIELGMRFRTPLREVSIQANTNIEGGSMPVVNYDPMVEDDNTNWDAGWEFSDLVLANADES